MVTHTHGAFAVILDDYKRVLCVKKNYGNMYWSLPGGGVEAGESPYDAVIREVDEETGFLFEPKELIGVYSAVFRCDIILAMKGDVLSRREWRPNAEISKVNFFEINNLPENMSIMMKDIIADSCMPSNSRLKCYATCDSGYDTSKSLI